MWGKKPEQSAPSEAIDPRAANPPKPAPAFVEGKTMSSDAMRPLANSSATARLGASLHVKGEITGQRRPARRRQRRRADSVGRPQADGRRKCAKVTADVVAREVVVYGDGEG